MLKNLNKDIRKFFKNASWIAGILLLILLSLLVMAMFGKSLEDGCIERELLVNTIATILSGYLGIIGVLIGIWGTYTMFIVQKEDEKNKDKIYIKKELEYSLSETSYLTTALQVIYAKNYSRYYDYQEWKKEDITTDKTTGYIMKDIKIIQNIVITIDLLEPNYLEINKDKLDGNILNISDIYLFYKKFEKEFNDKLLKKYTSNISLSNDIIEKSIYTDLPISHIKEWIKILNGEIEYIDIFRFIYIRKEIKLINDSIK